MTDLNERVEVADREFERCPDPVDQASRLDLEHTAESVAAARAAAVPKQKPNANGEYEITECEECGDDIHPVRLAHGFVTCVGCQEHKETINKRRMRGY